MKKSTQISLLLTSVLFVSCLSEVKEKFSKAQADVSNATTFVEEVQKVEGRIEKLKEATPLTNQQLKEWLPPNIGALKRTGFKIGQAGMYQVNSVEGTYKETESNQKFNVTVIDGAGPTGSMMSASYGLLGNFEMETEDEYKHQQTVTVDGIKAQQTYKKKNNNTQLIFAYQERFLVNISSTDMNVDETWAMTNMLDLDKLIDLVE